MGPSPASDSPTIAAALPVDPPAALVVAKAMLIRAEADILHELAGCTEGSPEEQELAAITYCGVSIRQRTA